MLSRSELRYTLALQRVPNIGDTSAKKLISSVGSAEGIFKESANNLLKIEGIGVYKLKGLNELQYLDAADEELQFIENNGIAWSYYLDSDYPDPLKHCIDGPILFFHQGNIDLQNKKIISVVGTRNVTNYGRKCCKELIDELAPLNPVIVSGFAYGVDILAHRAAINNGLQTIVCLAHGLDQIYPKGHKKYVQKINENGGLISEFWSSDPFERNNFLKRNRIIAGLSQATIVIESALKGGSLVTADIANSYNRDVFAFPGRVNDHHSQGCNNLIKTQQAQMITQAADIIYMLDWEIEESDRVPPKQTKLFIDLSEDEKIIYNYLKAHKKQLLDTIALQCNISTSKALTILFNMELKGVVRPLPGKLFELL